MALPSSHGIDNYDGAFQLIDTSDFTCISYLLISRSPAVFAPYEPINA